MPKLLKTPFAIDAAEGFRTDIQESTGAAPNSATYQVGFPPVTMQSIASNGMPPKGSDLNGVLYDITDNLVFLTQGGGYGFNSAYATSIGGYPLNARLRLTNGDIVKSTLDGNTNDPNTDMTGWVKTNSASQIFDANGLSQQEINDEVGGSLAGLSFANKTYATLAAANADIANIALNQSVWVSSENEGGLYEKKTEEATALTKSPYDPVEQAKNYTDSLVGDVPIKNKSDLDDLAVSVAFSDNSRTWLESNKYGLPTDHTAKILKDTLNISDLKDYAEYSVAFVYEDDSVLFGFDKEANPKFYGKNPYNAYGFVAYGDSTTEGADLVNPLTERWTTLLSAQIGKVIENRGISGARAEEIQARFGAINANMSVASNTIPASGIVILTAVDINPVRLGGSLQVELLCEDFTKVKGTLARASDTTATFTRSIAGSAITTNRVKVISTSQNSNRKKIMFLGQGINNEGLVSSGTQTLDQIKSWYKSGVTHLSAANPEYVVWGVLDRGVSEAVGTPNGDFIKDLESWLLVEFGSRYAPVRQFLSSQYAIDIAEILEPSFTPTTADTDAIAVGRTPPSFRTTAGSVHLNALGHKLQTWFFKQYLISRGII